MRFCACNFNRQWASHMRASGGLDVVMLDGFGSLENSALQLLQQMISLDMFRIGATLPAIALTMTIALSLDKCGCPTDCDQRSLWSYPSGDSHRRKEWHDYRDTKDFREYEIPTWFSTIISHTVQLCISFVVVFAIANSYLQKRRAPSARMLFIPSCKLSADRSLALEQRNGIWKGGLSLVHSCCARLLFERLSKFNAKVPFVNSD